MDKLMIQIKIEIIKIMTLKNKKKVENSRLPVIITKEKQQINESINNYYFLILFSHQLESMHFRKINILEVEVQ